jgi:hypothetical protein
LAISGGKGRPDELNIRPFSSSSRVVAPTPSRSVKEARQPTFIRREVVDSLNLEGKSDSPPSSEGRLLLL